MDMFEKISKCTVAAFSLMEMAMVLLVIGIIAGAMFKGRDVIEAAQIRSVVSDMETLRIAYDSYVSAYGSLPGDDSAAASRFKNVESGDGDGSYSEPDAAKFFSHLYAAGLIGDAEFKIPKIGGKYIPSTNNGSLRIKISDGNTATISRKQVIQLKAKMMEVTGRDPVETSPSLEGGKADSMYVVEIAIR
jgi:type II secretory pathway pseudopilin PulG